MSWIGSYQSSGSYTKHIQRIEFENSVLGSAVVISERDAYTTTVFSEGFADDVVGAWEVDEDVGDEVEVLEAVLAVVEVVDAPGFRVR